MKNNELNFDDIYNQASKISLKYYSHEEFSLPVLMNKLIKLERKIIDKRGKNKSRAEGHILTSLDIFFEQRLSHAFFKDVLLNKKLISTTEDENLKTLHLLSFEMFELAKDILNFKMRYDNFSSERKAFAISVICNLLYKYTIENYADYFRELVNVKSDKLKIVTFQNLEMLFTDTQLKLPDDIVEKLYKLTTKSTNRSVVFGAVNVLIALGLETVESRLDIIDDWKEKTITINNEKYP